MNEQVRAPHGLHVPLFPQPAAGAQPSSVAQPPPVALPPSVAQPAPGAHGTLPRAEHSPRTQMLLHGAIIPTLLRMAWPNILVMLVQASTGLIETWWVSHLGTDALTGMAVVFPGFMMMQML